MDDKNDKLGEIKTIVDESVKPYFTDIYSPWETKEQLRIGKEVKEQATTTKTYCFATKSSTQSISTATWTVVTLDTYETNDTDMSATADRITITKAWQYLINAQVQFASNATGIREAFMRTNWSTIFLDTYATTNPSDITSVVLTTMKTFAVGDYVDIKAFQTSWGNLNVNSWMSNTFLSVHQL